jgi:hypothetical protein
MCSDGGPESSLQQLQQAFVAHIRQPWQVPVPQGVAPARMAIYSELFFNNVESFLADSFPVLHQLLPKARWLAMARDFFARHVCATPLFTRLGEEFLCYLQQERGEHADDPPYLAELAHYEWVELALMLSQADSLPVVPPPAGKLLECPVRLSSLAWPLSYRFPVHRIGGDNEANSAAGPVYLLVYRNREECVVFLEIDALTHALLSHLQSEGAVVVGELLEMVAEIAGSPSNAELIKRGRALFESLIERGVIGVAAVPG